MNYPIDVIKFQLGHVSPDMDSWSNWTNPENIQVGFQLGHVSSDMDRKLVEHVAGSGNVFQLGHFLAEMDSL